MPHLQIFLGCLVGFQLLFQVKHAQLHLHSCGDLGLLYIVAVTITARTKVLESLRQVLSSSQHHVNHSVFFGIKNCRKAIQYSFVNLMLRDQSIASC